MVGKNLTEFITKNSNFSILNPNSNILNLCDKESIENYFSKNEIDVIVHCAGRVGGIQANILEPYYFLEKNLLRTAKSDIN